MSFKKYVKKGLIALAICAMVVPSIKANADEVNSSTSISGSAKIDLNNPESSDTQMSEAMNYDEFVAYMAKNENISIEEAKKIIGEEPLVPYDEAVEQKAEEKNISISKARELINKEQLIDTETGVQVRATYYKLS